MRTKQNPASPIKVRLAKIIRESAGIKAADVARMMGRTRQDYHLFEKSYRTLSLAELVTLRDLFKGTDAEFIELVRKCAKE